MKLLLHACCGPCSLEPVRLLLDEGHTLCIAYMNSNIYPHEEYIRRRNTLMDWAKSQDIPVIEGVYNPDLWKQSAGVIASQAEYRREDRCRACYQFRFHEAAEYAQTHGYDGICTTLSVSPYQFTDIIAEEMKVAATARGLKLVFRDFRPQYLEATRKSKEVGMYRQNYCGCHLSFKEAQAEREERKRQRKAAKEKRAGKPHASQDLNDRVR